MGCEHPENGQPFGMPYFQSNLAEGKGFEPPEPCGSSDFESDAIDHSESIPAVIPTLALFWRTFGLRGEASSIR